MNWGYKDEQDMVSVEDGANEYPNTFRRLEHARQSLLYSWCLEFFKMYLLE